MNKPKFLIVCCLFIFTQGCGSNTPAPTGKATYSDEDKKSTQSMDQSIDDEESGGNAGKKRKKK